MHNDLKVLSLIFNEERRWYSLLGGAEEQGRHDPGRWITHKDYALEKPYTMEEINRFIQLERSGQFSVTHGCPVMSS
jgi:hypothetical protein